MIKKQQQNFIVRRNIKTGDGLHILTLSPEVGTLPEILPGQFVNVLVSDSRNTFLRRPISIHNVDYKENYLSLAVKNVGDGTSHICGKKEGEVLNLLIPLGNGFSTDFNQDETILLVGGGIGAAPLLYLSSVLRKKGAKVKVLIGARKESDLPLADKFCCFADTQFTTEDGSRGVKGFVTDHPWLKEPDCDMIMCCGPMPMMKAVAGVADKNGIGCEVSLENTMACGLGACLCCVEDTKEGHKCVCTEGPVFNIKDLKWNENA